MKATNERSVQSLERALDILDLIRQAPRKGLSLKEICSAVNLHPSTAHHLIRTMVGHAYLSQDRDTRRYLLGPGLLRLRATALEQLDLHKLAEEVARDLVAQTGETVYVQTLHDFELITLISIVSPHPVRVVRPEGKELHATAGGKCLMAYQSQSTIQQYLAAAPLPKFTPNTITDPDLLRAELAQIHVEQVAFDREEHVLGVGCIAAPVFDHIGAVVAAISIDFPTYRRDAARHSEWAAAVKACAERLSMQLGSVPASNVGVTLPPASNVEDGRVNARK